MSENNRKTYSTSSLCVTLHYIKKCSKSDPTDRLEPAGNGCKMSDLNLEPARLTEINSCRKLRLSSRLIKAIMTYNIDKKFNIGITKNITFILVIL